MKKQRETLNFLALLIVSKLLFYQQFDLPHYMEKYSVGWLAFLIGLVFLNILSNHPNKRWLDNTLTKNDTSIIYGHRKRFGMGL